MIGIAQGCLDATIPYTLERKQFGKDIFSFQVRILESLYYFLVSYIFCFIRDNFFSRTVDATSNRSSGDGTRMREIARLQRGETSRWKQRCYERSSYGKINRIRYVIRLKKQFFVIELEDQTIARCIDLQRLPSASQPSVSISWAELDSRQIFHKKNILETQRLVLYTKARAICSYRR